MARTRVIHPNIWTDKRFTRLSPSEKLLFIGIISHSDDFGISEADASTLRIRVFPADTCGDDDVARWRDALYSHGLICYYRTGENEYAHLPQWSKYQHVPKPHPSIFPECPVCGEGVQISQDDSFPAVEESVATPAETPAAPLSTGVSTGGLWSSTPVETPVARRPAASPKRGVSSGEAPKVSRGFSRVYLIQNISLSLPLLAEGGRPDLPVRMRRKSSISVSDWEARRREEIAALREHFRDESLVYKWVEHQRRAWATSKEIEAILWNDLLTLMVLEQSGDDFRRGLQAALRVGARTILYAVRVCEGAAARKSPPRPERAVAAPTRVEQAAMERARIEHEEQQRRDDEAQRDFAEKVKDMPVLSARAIMRA